MPLLQRYIDSRNGLTDARQPAPFALILLPTAELAVQTASAFNSIARELDLTAALLYKSHPLQLVPKRSVSELVQSHRRLDQRFPYSGVIVSTVRALAAYDMLPLLDSCVVSGLHPYCW
jgi:hypothetical protein